MAHVKHYTVGYKKEFRDLQRKRDGCSRRIGIAKNKIQKHAATINKNQELYLKYQKEISELEDRARMEGN